MNREFWIDRWNENKIGFHRTGVHPLLACYWPSVRREPAERVLVPLCGKSEDMRWLRDQGHTVVGVDLSERAARAFGQEQGIVFAEGKSGPLLTFDSPNLQFNVGDFLQFSGGEAGAFPLFYDRAALIALPQKMRPAYVKHLVSLLAPDARGLLIALEYDNTQMDGPPFSVEEEEIRSLFEGFQIERLFVHDCLEEEKRFKERGVQWMREALYSLVRKQAK